TIELLKERRDMTVQEIRLVLMIEDPREAERRRQMGIENESGCSRDEIADAFLEVCEDRVPADRMVLRKLAQDMRDWPRLRLSSHASPLTPSHSPLPDPSSLTPISPTPLPHLSQPPFPPPLLLIPLHHAVPPPRHSPYTPLLHHAIPPPRLSPTTPFPLHANPPPRHSPYTPLLHHAIPPPRLSSTTPFPLHANPPPPSPTTLPPPGGAPSRGGSGGRRAAHVPLRADHRRGAAGRCTGQPHSRRLLCIRHVSTCHVSRRVVCEPMGRGYSALRRTCRELRHLSVRAPTTSSRTYSRSYYRTYSRFQTYFRTYSQTYSRTYSAWTSSSLSNDVCEAEPHVPPFAAAAPRELLVGPTRHNQPCTCSCACCNNSGWRQEGLAWCQVLRGTNFLCERYTSL
ncbi:unnamed protein product, partial [Closterium sp. Naga37s-1]